MDPNAKYVPLFGNKEDENVEELHGKERRASSSDIVKSSSPLVAPDVRQMSASPVSSALSLVSGPPPPTAHRPPSGYKPSYRNTSNNSPVYSGSPQNPTLPSIAALLSQKPAGIEKSASVGTLMSTDRGFPVYAQHPSLGSSATLVSPQTPIQLNPHHPIRTRTPPASYPQPMPPYPQKPPLLSGLSAPSLTMNPSSSRATTSTLPHFTRPMSSHRVHPPTTSNNLVYVENRNTNGQDVNVPLRSQQRHQIGPPQVRLYEPPPTTHLPTYKAIIRQQPLRARMCGCGDKDRRTVDPPPILEILKHDPNDPDPTYKPMQDDPFLIVRASLWSEDGKEEVKKSDRVPKEMSILIGNLAEPAQVLLDEHDKLGCFCVFADLSIRIENDFLLKFSVYDLKSPMEWVTSPHKGRLVCEVSSNPFRAMSPKEFPGMVPSSALSKALRDQGVKMLVRKERGGASATASVTSTRKNSEKSESD